MSRKVIKVKRKRINLSFVVLLLSFLIYVATRTFLGSYNVTLGIKYQQNLDRILELSKQSESLRLDVQNLSSYDRIRELVDNGDMYYNANNVIDLSN